MSEEPAFNFTSDRLEYLLVVYEKERAIGLTREKAFTRALQSLAVAFGEGEHILSRNAILDVAILPDFVMGGVIKGGEA